MIASACIIARAFLTSENNKYSTEMQPMLSALFDLTTPNSTPMSNIGIAKKWHYLMLLPLSKWIVYAEFYKENMNSNILYKIFIFERKGKRHITHKWVIMIYIKLTECKWPH